MFICWRELVGWRRTEIDHGSVDTLGGKATPDSSEPPQSWYTRKTTSELRMSLCAMGGNTSTTKEVVQGLDWLSKAIDTPAKPGASLQCAENICALGLVHKSCAPRCAEVRSPSRYELEAVDTRPQTTTRQPQPSINSSSNFLPIKRRITQV